MSLKKIRRAKGWSQEQLAEISGVSIRTVQRLEAGEMPGLETQKALAAAFDCSLEDLNEEMAAQEASSDEANQALSLDKESMVIIRFGWKGLLYHLATMMLVTTWLYFLSREFNFSLEAVNYILFLWVFALLGHTVTLLGKKD